MRGKCRKADGEAGRGEDSLYLMGRSEGKMGCRTAKRRDRRQGGRELGRNSLYLKGRRMGRSESSGGTVR